VWTPSRVSATRTGRAESLKYLNLGGEILMARTVIQKDSKGWQETEAEARQMVTVTANPAYAGQVWKGCKHTLTSDDHFELSHFASGLLKDRGTVRAYAGRICMPRSELFSVAKARRKADDKLIYRVGLSVFVRESLVGKDFEMLVHEIKAQGHEIHNKGWKPDGSRRWNPGYKVYIEANIGRVDLGLDPKAQQKQLESFKGNAVAVAERLSGFLLDRVWTIDCTVPKFIVTG